MHIFVSKNVVLAGGRIPLREEPPGENQLGTAAMLDARRLKLVAHSHEEAITIKRPRTEQSIRFRYQSLKVPNRRADFHLLQLISKHVQGNLP